MERNGPAELVKINLQNNFEVSNHCCHVHRRRISFFIFTKNSPIGILKQRTLRQITLEDSWKVGHRTKRTG